MLLFYSYYDNFSLKNYYKSKFLYILTPYVVWSALILLLTGNINGFKNFFMQIITGNCYYHLWYMGMILRILLLSPLIVLFTKQFMKTNKCSKILFFILYTILYWWILKNNNVITKTMGQWIFKNPSNLQQRFINITPITWSLYFVLGVYIIFNYKKFKDLILKHKKAISLLYVITLSYSYYINIKDNIGNPIPFIKFNHAIHIFCCIISILFFYLLSLYIAKYKNKLFYLLKYISKYSFPAYLIHVLIIAVISTIESCFISTSNCLLFSTMLCILVVIFTPFICNLICWKESFI